MAAEESISDVATADLQLAQHQQLWAEMEARQETYQQVLDMGEELQTQDRRHRKEVRLTISGGFAVRWCWRGLNSVPAGVGEAGGAAGRARQTGGTVEPETGLVGDGSPGAGLLQGRQQHGQNLQFTRGNR